MFKKTTIHDIGRELNLTPGTVSRALNHHPRISTKTKDLVQKKATELQYQRNKIASSLRSGKSHTIGVIIPSAQINFFGSVVHGIELLASSSGYNIILYQTEETTVLEKKAIDTFLSARVDGILASVAKETANFRHFRDLREKHNIPLVIFDRTNDEIKVPSVVIDDYKGAYLATEHLINNGYTNIAHVSGPQHIKCFRDRLKGYQDALLKNHVEISDELVYAGDLSISSGRLAIEHFFLSENRPDAIFAVEDYTAVGIIMELKERKIKIPGEFGVIGFANENFGEYITPSLSSVDQQTVKMGQASLGLLMQMIAIKEEKLVAELPGIIVLEPILHFRDSSAGKKT
ncbi:MAG: LacI family DNA-binding transcriptional regulator [Ferruginibacter sp.]